MRYMATIYVSDVMTDIAATVEIQGWEHQYGPPETVWEKTYVWPGIGELRPEVWLLRALQGLAVDVRTPPSEGADDGALSGGPHTISETGDRAQSMMGWTVVGGPGGEELAVTRSVSDPL